MPKAPINPDLIVTVRSGPKLRQAYIGAGYKAGEFARHVGMRPVRLSQLVTEAEPGIRLEYADRIAKALNAEVATFFEFRDVPTLRRYHLV